ncbi:cytochrome d ubiquinol oxidase subunit II [Roseateles chitosanitabidus]|uniref:cytochrome d ubiquinol oxidase subunit II n=1 Tax=Roseateles chitosanitabidus TaxID=65048 RepID=UPI0011DF5456|nr:cytochrome d ubiquinol oxidase subunit II [Roseateles chitosanitabidus]
MTREFWIETALWAVPLLLMFAAAARDARSWRTLREGVGWVAGIALVAAIVTGGRGCASGSAEVDCQPSPNGPICND